MIIFARNPVLGNVKTRLAQTIGDSKALEIYKKLLAHTAAITSNATYDKFVFYADSIQDSDSWDNKFYEKRLQRGNDLGDRMRYAFQELLSCGYGYVLIIGTDCYELTAEIIESGFRQLQDADAVIGPCQDGGYYLLGMKRLHESLFKNKSWSTASVCMDTVRDLQLAGLSYFLLPTLNDIDVEADLTTDVND